MAADELNPREQSKPDKLTTRQALVVLFVCYGVLGTIGLGSRAAYVYSIIFGSLGLLIAAVLIAIALIGINNRKDKLQVNDEIEALRKETLDDLITFQLDADEIIRTRGIGTSLQEDMENNPLVEKTIRRDLDRAILLLQKSTTPVSKLESVARAEIVKAKVLDELT